MDAREMFCFFWPDRIDHVTGAVSKCANLKRRPLHPSTESLIGFINSNGWCGKLRPLTCGTRERWHWTLEQASPRSANFALAVACPSARLVHSPLIIFSFSDQFRKDQSQSL